MKIFSANVVLTAIKVSIAFTNSLLSFRSRTRISYVAAGKVEEDRAKKDSLLILFTSITYIDGMDLGNTESVFDFKKGLTQHS